MELDVTSAFATLIGRLRVPDADAMNPGLLVVFPYHWVHPNAGHIPRIAVSLNAANDNTARRHA